MESRSVRLDNVHCGHCLERIKQEIGGLKGVISVSADLERRQFTFRWEEPADWPAIRNRLIAIDYPPSE